MLEKSPSVMPVRSPARMRRASAVRFIANTVNAAGTELNGCSAAMTYIDITWPRHFGSTPTLHHSR